ncbi:MAG: DedA family protein [Ignavibacteriaceae bacterium]
MNDIYFWISHYGYFGIFSLLVFGIIGLPIPDETLLTLSGYLIYKGHLHLIPTFIAAYLGSVCGISISYTIGKTFGHRFIIKYGRFFHITEERLKIAHNWFGKIGRWTLLMGYFIPGVRHVIAIFAGTSELPMWEFGVFAYSGAFIWTATFLSIGYFFGDHWKTILFSVEHHIIKSSMAVAAVLILFFIVKSFWKKKKSSKLQKHE